MAFLLFASLFCFTRSIQFNCVINLHTIIIMERLMFDRRRAGTAVELAHIDTHTHRECEIEK